MPSELREVPADAPRHRFLLISDLDGTLIPPEWREDLRAMRRRFARLVGGRTDLALAYATGRNYELAVEGIREHGLPLPDSLVCEVGSAVYHRRGESFEYDTHYQSVMEPRFGAGIGRRVRHLLKGVPGTSLQEEGKQGRFKVSFYVEPHVREGALLPLVREELGSLADRVNVVFSVDPADGRGLLDVVPAGVSKGSAAHYLRARLALETEQVVYAGDSGNDTAALLAGFNAVLVGNAPESLRAHLRKEAGSRGLDGRLHFAVSSYVSGVLEGCERFGLG